MKTLLTKLKTLAVAGMTMGLALGAQAGTTPDYLTFTAEEANSTVTLKCINTATAIYYSIDGGKNWVDCQSAAKASSGVSITLAKVGDKVMFKGTKVAYSNSKHFSMTGKIAASGDVGTMIDETGGQAVSSITCKYMFKGCTSLTTAPDLPATTLADSCYLHMFEGCTSLTAAPDLPATTLAEGCYSFMFSGCTALTAAPALSAMNLAKNCYKNMFSSCKLLTAAPALPATTLAEHCYGSMFLGCTSLTNAPALPATTLADSCYCAMFMDCTALTAVPALPATTLTGYCYYGMFSRCTSLVVNVAVPGKAWSIPAGTQTATDWNTDMFADCGGDVTAPTPGTTYYIRSAVAVIEPSAVEGAKVTEVSTNGSAVATAAPYVVEPNAAVTVVYAADEGYEFADGATTWTTNFTASAATVTVTIPEGEKPKATTADYTIYLKDGKAYKDKACETEITSDVAAKGLTYAEGAWTMTDFTFTTTTNTALEFLDETATLNVSGANAVTGGDVTDARSCGIDYQTLTITGGSTADTLTVTSGNVEGNYDCEGFDGGSLTVNTVTLTVGCGTADENMAMSVRSLTVNDAIVSASVPDESERGYGLLIYDSCEVTGTGVVVATGTVGVFGGSETAPKATAKATGTETILTWCEAGKGYTYMNGKAFATSVTLTEPQPDYLTFTAEQDGSSVTFKWLSADWVSNSTDGVTWNAYTAGTTISLAKVGDFVMFKGKGVKTGYDEGWENLYNFTMTGKIAASGDVGTLTDGKGGEDVALTEMCYYQMFGDCTSLTTAPALPATNLSSNCYGYMFSGCTALTAAPELPATELAESCYGSMFEYCSALTTAPALPATNLFLHCYGGMFFYCTLLTTAPELPATKLANECYMSMFACCESLTNAPALPATTLANECYVSMFATCTALVVNEAAPGKAWSIPAGTTTASNWNEDMFAGTGGTFQGAPEVGETYYVGAKKEVVGDDITVYSADGTARVTGTGSGELTKAAVDALKDKAITNLVVGSGVTKIGANAFDGWRTLRDVTIGADCTTVGEQAFLECWNLTNVTSAASSVTIGDYAFYRCNSLETMSFAAKPTWGTQSYTLQAGIYMQDGLPQVYAIPDIKITGCATKVYGTVKLGAETNWIDVTNLTDEQRKTYHFFKIVVE